ncbi:hypothetical protein [Rhodopirellula halodulae]|uniref:hypothetical protein n=1 Tax=Rhodopirellula halodulae TaxID=2894198 RepID=UPI001E37247B|nr:hypothetical protein [Rhodopirellula sp. JC737]MCC9654585.1 hypothetical protein [Rhodopirellula sp. JC737]
MANSKSHLRDKKGPLPIKGGASEKIEPKDLILDPGNLRLLELSDDGIRATRLALYGQDAIQDRLRALIVSNDRFGAKKLISSIKSNGYLRHEQLIVARFDGNSFLVLEGNRRVACVQHILTEFGNSLSREVRDSMLTLPCFVLQGDPIDDDEERLSEYRRDAEIYIGMRHLMESQSWDPASKYEFQARLIKEEGWEVDEVAERFGRRKMDVVRDLKAQAIYHKFREYEAKHSKPHKLTYNAFAEAAKAPKIMSWMSWSDSRMNISVTKQTRAFFDFLLERVRLGEGPEEERKQNAEQVVKDFNSMLRLEDREINELLTEGSFQDAEILYLDRREGDLERRIGKYVRALGRVSIEDMKHNPKKNLSVLRKLRDIINDLIETIEGMK